ncbi:S1 family peptidase [Vibrio porteresiae]|uniref:Serine protease n=1 Tax=Vibrio porteresiae DSM 19223 TaxID=1123496 RepID=A0ABZ0QCS5_9VIBR|nr:trypsin-like peptidase domain-containing protein [Vibrio porteresiae]WPC74258.1 serine protease [Vibrio porteresiae DSM 19223]
MACFRSLVTKLLKSFSIGLLAFITTGCAMSNGPLITLESTDSNQPAIDYEMIGIPLLYQGFGSSVPITKELSLTAAHVAKFNWDLVVAYHPDCDIAIIKSDNSKVENFPDLGLVYVNETVITYGKDGFGNMLKGKGVYHTDLHFSNNSYFKKCNASITDAPIREGMSGGGAFNEKGELIGIIAAIASKRNTRLANGEKLPYDRLSLFVSLNFVKDWLNSEVDNFYQSKDSVLTWSPTNVESQLAKSY